MDQINTKSRMNRLCLSTFILLCTVLISENAFSRIWERHNFIVEDNIKNAAYLAFLFYDSSLKTPNKHSYLNSFEIEYTEDRTHYFPLIAGEVIKQNSNDHKWLKITDLKRGQAIEFINGMKIGSDPNKIYVNFATEDYREKGVKKRSMSSNLQLLWTLPKSIKTIKGFRIKAFWTEDKDFANYQQIKETYPTIINNSNFNPAKKAPSVMSDSVKVIGTTDAIIVSGAKHGENIRVYNSKGIEVKSVVVKDDVVNIKLATNQSYLVKVGEFSQKVNL